MVANNLGFAPWLNACTVLGPHDKLVCTSIDTVCQGKERPVCQGKESLLTTASLYCTCYSLAPAAGADRGPSGRAAPSTHCTAPSPSKAKTSSEHAPSCPEPLRSKQRAGGRQLRHKEWTVRLLESGRKILDLFSPASISSVQLVSVISKVWPAVRTS